MIGLLKGLPGWVWWALALVIIAGLSATLYSLKHKQ